MVALRATLAAASAADTFQRGGEALRRFVEYAAPTKFSDLLEEEEEEDDEGAARSPASAARAVAAAAAGGSVVGAEPPCSGLSVTRVPTRARS